MFEGLVYVLIVFVCAVFFNIVIEMADGERAAKDLLPLEVLAAVFWPAFTPIVLMCVAVHYTVRWIKTKRDSK